MKGVVRIYGVGGFGTNIAYMFNNIEPSPGQAEIKVAYLDTSRSNLRSDINPDHFFAPEDMDGGGSVRRDTNDPLAKICKQFLEAHQPGDFNVVIFSASGGTGSVGGIHILSELLKRGIPAVAVVVGSAQSKIAALNTLKTLKSLENVVSSTEHPLVMHYSHNTDEQPRSEIDFQIFRVVSTLTILNSRENAGMDTRDVRNWVQYQHSTAVEPALSLLEVYDNNDDVVKNHKTPISLASLYTSPDDPRPKITPEYATEGYPTNSIKNFKVLHFVVDYAEVGQIAKTINGRIEELDRQHGSRIAATKLTSDKDQVSHNGLVL